MKRVNPKGINKGIIVDLAAVRGGNYAYDIRIFRSACRFHLTPKAAFDTLGVRLVLKKHEKSKES